MTKIVKLYNPTDKSIKVQIFGHFYEVEPESFLTKPISEVAALYWQERLHNFLKVTIEEAESSEKEEVVSEKKKEEEEVSDNGAYIVPPFSNRTNRGELDEIAKNVGVDPEMFSSKKDLVKEIKKVIK